MTRNSHRTGRKLYRSRNGVIFGVCRGLADYFNFSVFWTRAIVIGVFICTGFWPIMGIYILAALLIKTEPSLEIGSDAQNSGNRAYAYSHRETADRLKRKWRHLEDRIRKMEDKVTSREYDWNSRFFGR